MPKKKATDDVTQSLVIKNRHIMSESKPPDKPDSSDKPDVINTPSPKRDLTIQREDNSPDSADSQPANVSPVSGSSTRVGALSGDIQAEAPTQDSNDADAKADDTTNNQHDKTRPPVDETADETSNATADAAATQSSEPPASDEGDKGSPMPDVKKAVADAAQTEAREHELESYIEDKKFFIPIDTVAQKKSVKVSIGLTVLVVFLGVVLIDLMLDSGVILLVQKIPHTHFFSVKPPSE